MVLRFSETFSDDDINTGIDDYLEDQAIELNVVPGDQCPYMEGPKFEDCETREQQILWNEVQDYGIYLAKHYKSALYGTLRNYVMPGGGGIPDRTLTYLEESGLTDPNFKFRLGAEADILLGELGLGTGKPEISSDNGVLVFNLPKPLAKFWWKSDSLPGLASHRKPLGSVIEWGGIYYDLMPIVWNITEEFELGNHLIFDRINGLGQHVPDSYYYVWKVSLPIEHKEIKKAAA